MLDDSTIENQAKVVTPYPYEKIPKKLSKTLANVDTRGMLEDDIALAYARERFLNNTKDTIKNSKKELRAMLKEYKKGDI